MTIQTSDNKTIYVADGIETVFSFGFKTTSEDTIFIFIDGEEYLGEYFTALNINQDSAPGGNVAITIPPPAGESVTIVRIVPLLQETDYLEYDKFPARSHEKALDDLTLQSQQQQEEINRSLKSGIDTPVGVVYSLPSPEPGKGLLWNPAGDGIDNSEDDLNGITTAAQNSANDSEASANASAISAAESAASAAEAEAVFDSKLAGFGTDGLHPQIDGDLNTIARNSEYFITAADTTNNPVDFTSNGVIRTSMTTAVDGAIQVLYGHGTADKGRLWQRTLIAGVWDEWVRLGGAGAGSGVLGQVIYLPGLESIPSGEGIEEAAGQLVSRSDYPQLWNAVSGFALADADWITKSNAGANGVSEYSSGDLSTTFRLPDLRGEFIRGMNTTGSDPLRDPDRVDNSKEWQAGGVESHNHALTDPGHTHTIDGFEDNGNSGPNVNISSSSNQSADGTTNSRGTGISIAAVGGSETRPRNIPAIVAIVCLTASELVNLSSTPTGSVMQSFGPQTSGWLACNGAAIPSQHVNLIAIIGANTPDLRGQFLRGWSDDALVDPDGPRTANTAQDQAVGVHGHTATQPPHHHEFNMSNTEGDQNYPGRGSDSPAGNALTKDTTPAVTVADSTGPETRPKNIAVFHYIKT